MYHKKISLEFFFKPSFIYSVATLQIKKIRNEVVKAYCRTFPPVKHETILNSHQIIGIATKLLEFLNGAICTCDLPN